jgi:hypothetical protein
MASAARGSSPGPAATREAAARSAEARSRAAAARARGGRRGAAARARAIAPVGTGAASRRGRGGGGSGAGAWGRGAAEGRPRATWDGFEGGWWKFRARVGADRAAFDRARPGSRLAGASDAARWAAPTAPRAYPVETESITSLLAGAGPADGPPWGGHGAADLKAPDLAARNALGGRGWVSEEKECCKSQAAWTRRRAARSSAPFPRRKSERAIARILPRIRGRPRPALRSLRKRTR